MKLQKALIILDRDRANNKIGIGDNIFHVVDGALFYECKDTVFDITDLDDLMSNKWYVICG